MVTDGILYAVQGIIDKLQTKEERHAGKIIWDMLSDFDEDKWYLMSNEQKQEWLNGYINKR